MSKAGLMTEPLKNSPNHWDPLHRLRCPIRHGRESSAPGGGAGRRRRREDESHGKTVQGRLTRMGNNGMNTETRLWLSAQVHNLPNNLLSTMRGHGEGQPVGEVGHFMFVCPCP